MTILSDKDIARDVGNGELVIRPWNPRDQLQPASYDCKLGDTLRVPGMDCWVDPQRGMYDRQLWFEVHMPNHVVPGANRMATAPGQVLTAVGAVDNPDWAPGFWLAPGQFVLGHTVEWVGVPDYMSARIEGKSTLGRWGLVVHVTAGFVDPGFSGQLTLELRNVGPFHLLLRPGMPISQVSFSLMSSKVERQYGEAGNHYQGQVGAQPAL